MVGAPAGAEPSGEDPAAYQLEEQEEKVSLEPGQPEELGELMSMSSSDSDGKKRKKEADDPKALRPRAVKEAAHSLAAQKAFKWRYEQINTVLNQETPRLNVIFNFHPHTLRQGEMMPPVVAEAGPAHRLEKPTMSVKTNSTYQVIKDARLLTVPPDWRIYLMADLGEIEDVHPDLLPRDELERAIWRKAVKEAWEAGIRQADYEFNQGVRRLERDIKGVIRYRALVVKGMMSIPAVATAEKAVEITESGGKLQVGKKVTEIVSAASFQGAKYWKPVVKIR